MPDLGASGGVRSEWGRAGSQFASFCNLVYRGAAVSNHRAPEYVDALIVISLLHYRNQCVIGLTL